MAEKSKYFVIREKAVPEVLLKVVEAKRLLDSERVPSVQEAVDRVGISRSSFYKYQNDIFRFMTRRRGRPSPSSCRWRMNRGFCLWY